MNSDLVSVVIPVYNSEKFLKKTMESVINQTYKNIEIICVDDGSTDNSLAILKEYSDKIIIISQKNQGLGAALNAGIKKISGNWMKWISPDDILHHDAIDTLVQEAKKLPENTILYSNWELIDENDKKMRDFYETNYNDLDSFEFNVRLLDCQQVNVNTSLIPSSLFKTGCIPQNLKDTSSVDYDFFLRAGILHGTRFYLVKKSILKYRIHKGQVSHRNIAKTLENLETVRNGILSKLDEPTLTRYRLALARYQRQKPLGQKLMRKGLHLTSILPEKISDGMITFYLNKIRSNR